MFTQHHYYLLFHSSAYHQLLHSFPTRRSSDLLHQLAGHVDRADRLALSALPFDARHALEDRKSTRLNSSHLGISYAVFCLKKKKINNKIISLINKTIYLYTLDEVTKA